MACDAYVRAKVMVDVSTYTKRSFEVKGGEDMPWNSASHAEMEIRSRWIDQPRLLITPNLPAPLVKYVNVKYTRAFGLDVTVILCRTDLSISGKLLRECCERISGTYTNREVPSHV